MAKEIEHKYLVISESFKDKSITSYVIIQGYICKEVDHVVRVRICDNNAYLTIKGKNKGDTRKEFEYEIPYDDAQELIKMCEGEPIIKKRWIVDHNGYKWEIDEFLNRNVPILAEIELQESCHSYPIPDFVGKEVTGDVKYYNSNI